MKKMLTKILAVALCVVMTLTAAPLGGFVGLELPSLFDFKAEAAAYSGTCGENLTWSLDTESGILEISGTGPMTDWSSYKDVPWNAYESSITSVVIGNGVTTIGIRAFCYCYSVTSVSIPDGVVSIGDLAFYSCDLTSITFPESVTTIGESAFYRCENLTSLILPDKLTTIGEGAFYNCEGLTSIIIPDSVTTIGEDAFCSCDSLERVTIGSGVTTIGDDAFDLCKSLTSFYVYPDNPAYSSDSYGVLFNKNKTVLLQHPRGNTRTSYIIPDSVTVIGEYAFYNSDNLTNVELPGGLLTIDGSAFDSCDNLSSIEIPDSVTTIGRQAFFYCKSLTGITIPGKVTTIGLDSFYYCIALTSFNVDADNEYYSSDDGVLFNKDKTELIQYPAGNTRTSYTIPDSVTTICDEAFNSCYTLKCVAIPKNVKTIGFSAFAGCNNLLDIYYAGSAMEWSDISIYFDNELLTSATIHYDFYGPCPEPDEDTTIKSGNCGDEGDNLTWTFDLDTGVLAINGTGAMADWWSASDVPWHFYCDSITSIEISNGVKTIGESAFIYCDSLENVTIPDSVTSIGRDAFFDCGSLESITIPDSVVSIGDAAFSNCKALTAIVLPNGITSISDSLFGNCKSLVNITIPNSVISIGMCAFCECYSLTSIIIPKNVTDIGSYAFRNCAALTNITIPEKVTSIGYEGFAGCINLTSITIPQKVTSINAYAFKNCNNLTDVYYGSTEENWNKISIDNYNEPLTNATIHFSDNTAEAPADYRLLRDAIKQAELLDKFDYSIQSWAVLVGCIGNGQICRT